MGLRFYRRFPVLPGVRVNLGTRGASVSFGHRGAWYTVGTHGRRTATLGWPGSGLRYTTTASGGQRPGVPAAPSAMASLIWLLGIGLVIWMLVHAAR